MSKFLHDCGQRRRYRRRQRQGYDNTSTFSSKTAELTKEQNNQYFLFVFRSIHYLRMNNLFQKEKHFVKEKSMFQTAASLVLKFCGNYNVSECKYADDC